MTPFTAELIFSREEEKEESAATAGRGLAFQARPATAIPTARRTGEDVPFTRSLSGHRRPPPMAGIS